MPLTRDLSSYPSFLYLLPQVTHSTLFIPSKMAGESEKRDPNTVASVSSDTASIEKTAGVSKIEGVTLAWSAKGLWIAWAGIMLLAVAISLDSQTIYSFQPYATSKFGAHSLLATIGTVQNIMYAVTKPPVAKIADVFGYGLLLSPREERNAGADRYP